MALTIRKLSIQAENNLQKIIEDNRWINSKSKAIEHALELYSYHKEKISKMNDSYNELAIKHDTIDHELDEIKKALKTLKEFI